MHKSEVKIIADSINDIGKRITTFQLRYWRAIHSELLTHRVFSRNAGSSRARPSKAIINQVMTDPWGPLHWGANEPGMQANSELPDGLVCSAKHCWKQAAKVAATHAQVMESMGVHKQIVNRLLEPFTYIDVVLTSTDYANWFALRNHKDAQPEIRELAQAMQITMDSSTPVLLKYNEWHLPYISIDDFEPVDNFLSQHCVESTRLGLFKKISAARCARVSYKAFDGSTTSVEADLALFDKLVGNAPIHASPTEHQATPDSKYYHNELHGNFDSWIQYRKTLPNEFIAG